MSDMTRRYGKWALVTGASAGIGYEFARQLAAAGMNLVLVARRQQLLASRAVELTREFHVEVESLVLDLTADNAVEKLLDDLADKEIDIVVMNAGTQTFGPFTEIPLERQVELQRLNIDVPMRMARLFGAPMAKRRRGALIFVASLFGYQGVPLVANYAASKSYILTLGEALQVELKPFGVDVLVVSPGLTATDMPEQMPIDFRKIPITRSNPAHVVRTALSALGKKPTVVPGLLNKFYAWQNRLVPRSWPVKLFGFLLKNAMRTRAQPIR